MNGGSQEVSLFEAITGMLVFVSFLVFGFCAASLRSHVDEELIRKEDSVSSILRSPLPPERVLTATGRRRAKIAKVALVVFALTAAIIVIRNQMRGS